MARLDPAIPLIKAPPCHIIGIAASSPAMTAGESVQQSVDRGAIAYNVSGHYYRFYP
jgi:hypothetical protein